MTNLVDATLERFADALFKAQSGRDPIEPLTEQESSLSLTDAYAIQRINVERHVEAGHRIVGRKAGLTSPAMQKQLGVSEPDFGALLDSMAVEDGAEVPTATLIAPKVEAELAFVMAEDLAGPGVDTVHAMRSVGGVVPAIEIIDSRIADWRIKLVDTVADNASSGRFVVGSRVSAVDACDLALCGVVVTRNGSVAATGAGAAVLGNPIRCVAWLANTLGALGDGLREGDIVLAGSVHAALPVEPGDHVLAEFAHLGSVSVRFSELEGGGK